MFVVPTGNSRPMALPRLGSGAALTATWGIASRPGRAIALLAFALAPDNTLGWAARFADGRIAGGPLRLLSRPETIPGERYLRLRQWLRAFHIGAGGLAGIWIEAEPSGSSPGLIAGLLAGRNRVSRIRAHSAYSACIACWCAGRGVPLHRGRLECRPRLPRATATAIPIGEAERLARALLGLAIGNRSTHAIFLADREMGLADREMGAGS